MTKQIYLQFADGPRAVATLHTALAPVTTENLWSALARPVEVTAVHAMFAGPEIMTGLPEEAQSFDPQAIPAENQNVIPSAGDLIWYYQPANQMAGMDFELWEVGVFYAPGGRIFGPLGWTPCNIFGAITEGLDEFAVACQETRLTGAKKLVFGRVE